MLINLFIGLGIDCEYHMNTRFIILVIPRLSTTYSQDKIECFQTLIIVVHKTTKELFSTGQKTTSLYIMKQAVFALSHPKKEIEVFLYMPSKKQRGEYPQELVNSWGITLFTSVHSFFNPQVVYVLDKNYKQKTHNINSFNYKRLSML